MILMSSQGKEPLMKGRAQVSTVIFNPLPVFLLSSWPPSPSKVQVLYGGTDLFDYEVRRTFNNDMLLAFISSSCIAALVYILTSCSGTAAPKGHMSQSPLSLLHTPAEIALNPVP